MDAFPIHRAWITRIDRDGDVLWTTRLFTPTLGVGLGRYFSQDLIWTGDGGVMAIGSKSVEGPGFYRSVRSRGAALGGRRGGAGRRSKAE